MFELLIEERDWTRQRFCGSAAQALEDAREALNQGKPVKIVPIREYDETP